MQTKQTNTKYNKQTYKQNNNKHKQQTQTRKQH